MLTAGLSACYNLLQAEQEGEEEEARVPRASQPASASEEVVARQRWTGATLAGGVLTIELADFCASGVSIVLASCGPAGRPVVGRGLACRIGGEGRMRIVLRRSSNHALLDALASGWHIAATFTQPTTHRSIQIKAKGATVSEPEVADGPAVMAQTLAFRRELVDVGYPDIFAATYVAFEPHELVALDFLPEQAFVQTPGPSAGSALRP